MTGTNMKPLCPRTKIQVNFYDSQDWRVPSNPRTTPTFLASQKISGFVDVKYQKAVHVQEGDHVHVAFIGGIPTPSLVKHTPMLMTDRHFWHDKMDV